MDRNLESDNFDSTLMSTLNKKWTEISIKLGGKAMRSMKIIEYSIIIRVGTIILQ